MSKRVVNLGFAVGAALFIAIVGSRLIASAPELDLSTVDGEVAPPPQAGASPAAEETPSPMLSEPAGSSLRATSQRDTRTYAVNVIELQGLPPDAAPGTELEVWVAWEPPLSDEPQYQLLLKRVVLEKIIPGIAPEAPSTALLRLDASEVSDILYGDRFGALSVAVLPAA